MSYYKIESHSMAKNFCCNLLSDPSGRLHLETRELRKKKVKKIEKICRFCKKKMIKFMMLKCWNHSTSTKKCAVNYYKNSGGDSCHLGLKKLKNDKIFEKSWKVWKLGKTKLRVFSDRLFERSHGGEEEEGGGIGGGGGLMGAGWQQCGGENSAGGWWQSWRGWGQSWEGGSTEGVSSTSENRLSHHKNNSSKHFELKQSRQSLRVPNARWALPIYPILEDEKSKASDEKSVKRKIA